MIPEEPKRLYFSIGEVAKSLGCHASKIRFYEDEFNIMRRRNHRAERTYRVDEIGRLAVVLRLVSYLKIAAARKVYHKGKAESVLAAIESGNIKPDGSWEFEIQNGYPMKINP